MTSVLSSMNFTNCSETTRMFYEHLNWNFITLLNFGGGIVFKELVYELLTHHKKPNSCREENCNLLESSVCICKAYSEKIKASFN